MGWRSMYEPKTKRDALKLKYVSSVYTGKRDARIYSQTPFLRFVRLGRWEGAPGVRLYRKIIVTEPYWFEATIRTGKSLLYRKARTDWRQLGDYHNFPTLDDYVRRVLVPKEYPGLTVSNGMDSTRAIS